MRAWSVLIGIFVVCCLVGIVIAPPTGNQGFADVGSVIGFATLVAVGIERVIEASFIALSGRLGQWWPLSVVRDQFAVFESQTDALLGPVLKSVQDGLRAAIAAGGTADATVAQLEARLSALDTAVARERDRIADAQRHLAPGSPRLKLVADSLTALSAHLDDASRLAGSFATDARTALATAREGADRALLLIGSFTDNPARRLASLILGAGLGVLVAAGVGINIFLATLGSGGSRATGSSLSDLLLGTLGIIVTGVILGLGLAPTHEVIKALQGYKDQRNGVTVDRPAAPLGRGPEGLAADPLVDATPVVRVRGTS